MQDVKAPAWEDEKIVGFLSGVCNGGLRDSVSLCLAYGWETCAPEILTMQGALETLFHLDSVEERLKLV